MDKSKSVFLKLKVAYELTKIFEKFPTEVIKFCESIDTKQKSRWDTYDASSEKFHRNVIDLISHLDITTLNMLCEALRMSN